MPGKSRKTLDQATTFSGSNVEVAPKGDAPEARSSVILNAISSLRTELFSIKSDIEEIIDSKIEQLAVSIRGELSAFKYNLRD